ncbi:MAG: response regulator [Candidatus Aminicenantes bacterium]|nr:response regulator [Candidatus Aminicenantes bacterium]
MKKERRTPKILIIDDDMDFVNATKTILETKSYKILAAYNKDAGMKIIESEQPDLIILDVMMDRLSDGFKLCYQLKHDPKYENIPVIIVTAVTKETGLRFSPKTDGEYLEAEDLISKPIKPDDLLNKVEDLLVGKNYK